MPGDTQPDRPNPAAATWDAETVASLRELQAPDEPDFVGELVMEFLNDAEKSLVVLRASAAAGDAPAAARAAHRIRGAALNLGAQRVAEAAKSLEQEAKSGLVAGLSARTEELAWELEHFAAKSRKPASA